MPWSGRTVQSQAGEPRRIRGVAATLRFGTRFPWKSQAWCPKTYCSGPARGGAAVAGCREPLFVRQVRIMTTSTTVRAIQFVSRAVADLGLSDAGFRRQGNHLHRHVEGLIHAVHFQASQWGSATSGSFTITLVVTSPFLYSTWTGRPFPSNPASALFPVTTRIGALMPSRKDQWWEVDAGTNLDALSREVAAAILHYGMPFFESFKSAESVLLRLRQGEGLLGLTNPQIPLVHAMLAAEAGARGEARELLQRACIAAGTSPFRRTVRLVSERLEIPCE